MNAWAEMGRGKCVGRSSFKQPNFNLQSQLSLLLKNYIRNNLYGLDHSKTDPISFKDQETFFKLDFQQIIHLKQKELWLFKASRL